MYSYFQIVENNEQRRDVKDCYYLTSAGQTQSFSCLFLKLYYKHFGKSVKKGYFV